MSTRIASIFTGIFLLGIFPAQANETNVSSPLDCSFETRNYEIGGIARRSLGTPLIAKLNELALKQGYSVKAVTRDLSDEGDRYQFFEDGFFVMPERAMNDDLVVQFKALVEANSTTQWNDQKEAFDNPKEKFHFEIKTGSRFQMLSPTTVQQEAGLLRGRVTFNLTVGLFGNRCFVLGELEDPDQLAYFKIDLAFLGSVTELPVDLPQWVFGTHSTPMHELFPNGIVFAEYLP